VTAVTVFRKVELPGAVLSDLRTGSCANRRPGFSRAFFISEFQWQLVEFADDAQRKVAFLFVESWRLAGHL